jgi:outer membrane protein assembly factor BamA
MTGQFDYEQVRFRYYGGGMQMQYPLSRFTRLDFGLNMINITRDFSRVFTGISDTDDTFFLYPEVTYTRDLTLPGFFAPRAGTRYAVSLTGSPPLSSDMIRFVSLLGDIRQYYHLGMNYVFAFRLSGAASFGRDSQNFYMGGMQNWINYRWADGNLMIDRLEDMFFTLPALPMRGHLFNSAIGNRFGLFNAEFRFPLIAAMLPGPIPILPLYNIEGAAFIDIGAAWQDATRDGLLMGSGFGLRMVLLGLPFRYDIGWPYDLEGDGGFGRRVHYFSIGVDF